MAEPIGYVVKGAIEDSNEIEVFFKTLENKYSKEYGRTSVVVGGPCYRDIEVRAYNIEGIEVNVANGSFISPQTSEISAEHFTSILIWDRGDEILRAKAQHKLEKMTGYELSETEN